MYMCTVRPYSFESLCHTRHLCIDVGYMRSQSLLSSAEFVLDLTFASWYLCSKVLFSGKSLPTLFAWRWSYDHGERCSKVVQGAGQSCLLSMLLHSWAVEDEAQQRKASGNFVHRKDHFCESSMLWHWSATGNDAIIMGRETAILTKEPVNSVHPEMILFDVFPKKAIDHYIHPMMLSSREWCDAVQTASMILLIYVMWLLSFECCDCFHLGDILVTSFSFDSCDCFCSRFTHVSFWFISVTRVPSSE